MLSIFRTNQFFASIFLLIYAIILCLPAFLFPNEWQPSSTGVLSEYVYSLVGYTGFVPDAIAVGLLFLQAVLLNVVITKYRMASEISLFPGLIYILICSLIPDMVHLSPVLMGNTFFIMALFEIMQSYKKYSAAINTFNTGLWVATGSLFYFSFIGFILVGWIGLGIMRAFNMKEKFMLLIGFVFPYFLVFTHYYWNDSLAYFISKQFSANIRFLDFTTSANWEHYLKFGLVILLILISVFSLNSYLKRKNIQVQKNVNVLFWGLLFGGITTLFQANITVEHLLIIGAPLGVFFSFNLINMSRSNAEITHLLFFVGVLLLQYQQLWFR